MYTFSASPYSRNVFKITPTLVSNLECELLEISKDFIFVKDFSGTDTQHARHFDVVDEYRKWSGHTGVTTNPWKRDSVVKLKLPQKNKRNCYKDGYVALPHDLVGRRVSMTIYLEDIWAFKDVIGLTWKIKEMHTK